MWQSSELEFIDERPPEGKCGLCWEWIDGNEVKESRPTGENFAWQTWAYHKECFNWMDDLRRSDVPLVRQG
jgi:hypothetical protein